MRVGRPRIWWGSGAYTPSTLRTTLGRERQRLYESSEGGRDKGTFRGPSDDQDDHRPTVFDRLLFFVPDFCGRSTKKGSGTIGTKTILGKMAALASILFCFGIKTYRRSDSQLWDKCITLLKHNDIFHVHFIDRCVYITPISCLP